MVVPSDIVGVNASTRVTEDTRDGRGGCDPRGLSEIVGANVFRSRGCLLVTATQHGRMSSKPPFAHRDRDRSQRVSR